MRLYIACWFVAVVACGSEGGSSNKIDAATPIDAPVDTQVVDVMIDAPVAMPRGQLFVIDNMSLPQSNVQARDFGLDLDGDGTVDNQLGMVISALAGMGLDSQIAMDRAIDTGTSIMIADIDAVDFTTDPSATFTIFQGANPMPPACANAQDVVCRKHLTGTGTFSLKPGAPVDPRLMGAITAGKLTAGPGQLTIQFVFSNSAPITATLIGARVDLATSATEQSGKLGGALTMTEIDTKLFPAMQAGFEAKVKQECTMLQSPPGCGCPADTTGKTLLGLFDTTPQDCSISVNEVRNNSLIVSLFAPDVTIDGKAALSLGVAVHAVAATLTP